DLPVGRGEVHGQPVDAHGAHLAMLDRGPEPPGRGVLVLVDTLLRALHRARGNTRGAESGGRRETLAARRPGADERVELVLTGAPAGLGPASVQARSTHCPWRWRLRWRRASMTAIAMW